MTLQVNIIITRRLICNALKRALRTGKFFRLPPAERAILYLSAKIVKTIVKSPELTEILLRIFEKINTTLTLKLKALIIGFKLAEQRVAQALAFGYTKALAWLDDIDYIFYLGLSHLNNPPILAAP